MIVWVAETKEDKPLKILVADDHVLIREGIRNTLQEISADVAITEAGNGKEVLEALQSSPAFDIVLLDLYMPETDGFELLGQLAESYPDTPVVILSASNKKSDMRRALDRGAFGFIPKTTPHDVMLNAIKLVMSGGVYVPPDLMKADDDEDEAEENATKIDDHELKETLTDRQFDVLVLLAKGKQNKEIARALGVSQHTVKIHVTAVFKALGVNNRTQAVIAAQKMGLAV